MLPDSIQIADGTLLHIQASGARALTIATDEDWAECLVAARLAVSRGSKAIPAGATWEAGLAAVAAWYLRCGIGQLAMGRNPNDKAWRAQRLRWEELVRVEAAKGPYALVRGFQDPGSHAPRVLTRAELEEIEPALRGKFVLVWYEDPEPTVMTDLGRVPFKDVPRETR